MAATVTDTVSDIALDDAMVDVDVDEMLAATPLSGPKRFQTGDGEVDGALEGGMRMSVTDRSTGRPVGRVTVYATEDNSPRSVPTTMLASILKKRRPDGSRAFSRRPLGEQQFGRVMCFLHPDHPGYAGLAAIGLGGRVCGSGETVPAAHLASEFDRDLHMAHRHGREWSVIRENRERLEREEERRLRREEIEAMKAMAAGAAGRKAG